MCAWPKVYRKVSRLIFSAKGDNKRDKHVTQARKFGYVAKTFNETMPLS